MKRFIKMILLSITNANLLLAFGGVPPSPPSFLKAEISGSPHLPPLFFADTNSVTLLAQLSTFTTSQLNGKIIIEGTSTEYSSDTDNKNLKWKLPAAEFNTGISFKIWGTQELFATFKFNSINGKVDFAGTDFGASFLFFNPGNVVRSRLDIGLHYVSINMNAKFIGSNYYLGDSTIYLVDTNEKGFGPFISLTIHTASDNWIVNPYLQASYSRLPLISTNNYDTEVYFASNTVIISPGITYRVSNKMLISVGGHYVIPSEFEEKSSPGILSGFVQTNFLF